MSEIQKVSKVIMNANRKKLLQSTKERGTKETNNMVLHNLSGWKMQTVDLAIDRFAELGLISFKGGGFFVLSEKGEAYLKENA
jgi:hypothetical protein